MSAEAAPRVMLVVTHLLGVGHLSRMAAIGRGLAAAGHHVLLASGGRPAPTIATTGMELVQLPPVHCIGVDFRTLHGDDGALASPATMRARREMLLAALARFTPDIVVTELYPFGRRQLAAEFDALVDAARKRRPRPALLASVRDILNPPSRPERVAEALERLGRFEAVLVHGDPAVTPLSASWPVDPALARRLRPTGYVAEGPAAPASPETQGEVLVSGGGSAASLPLFHAALGAAAMAADGPRWRILVGHGVAEADFGRLAGAAPGHVVVERARRDFPALLAGAAASVSQAGYNTIVDLLRAGTPAVVVPFEAGQEREQRLRAECFAARGLLAVLPEEDLSPAALADAVRDRIATGRRAGGSAPALDGVARCAAIVSEQAQDARRTARAWDEVRSALDDLAARGGRLRVWWRDDDAVEATPALDRLIELAAHHRAPLALAVIPARVEPSLAQAVREADGVTILQHGWSHADHAPPGAKSQELAGDLALRLKELVEGRCRLSDLFGARFLPVLVPPWNRIDPALVPELPSLGFVGLSTYGPRRAEGPARGLARINTHLDPIAWRQGGGLADAAGCLRGLAEAARDRADEPFGILSHHLVHDPWIWSFLEDLAAFLAEAPAVAFVKAKHALGSASISPVSSTT